MSDKETIESIIMIIVKQDGELFTYADCLDHILALLKENDYIKANSSSHD
jgi:hypothetical protein